MTTRSRLQSVQHHACRAARSPVLLLLFALLYAFVALLLRDGDDDTSFAVLRGSGDDADEVTTPVDEWEPEVPEVRLSYGEADRGPVKGGVEIYPVQVRFLSVILIPSPRRVAPRSLPRHAVP